MPHSIVPAEVLGTAAGAAAGYIAGSITELALDALNSPSWLTKGLVAVATSVTHIAVATPTKMAISAAMFDPVGVATAPSTSFAAGVFHGGTRII